MQIRLHVSGTYPSENLIDCIEFQAGVPYDVLDVNTSNGTTIYLIKNSKGEKAKILDKFCSVVTERDPTEYAYKANLSDVIIDSSVVYESKPVARRFMYVVVRTDLDLKDIIVQTAHAAYESGKEFDNDAERTSLIVLEVSDENALLTAKSYIEQHGIKCTVYEERSKQLGYTAIGTEALLPDSREAMKVFKLLKV